MGWFVAAVSGTPGTGKTALSKLLAKKFNLCYFDVNNFIKKNGLAEKFDKEMRCWVVNEVILAKKLSQEIVRIEKLQPAILMDKKDFFARINKFLNTKKNPGTIKGRKNVSKKQIFAGLVIDSHLSHYLPRKIVDLCIITKTSLKTLQKRLKKRRYSKKKIRKNLEAEAFDTCYEEALHKNHKIIVYNN